MLFELLIYLKKWWINSREYAKYNIVVDGLEGDFSEDYVVGQYVHINDSLVNDGVYKITALSSIKMTIDATLIPENINFIELWGLKLPPTIITLADEIGAYTSTTTATIGIKSESQGNRSVTYSESTSENSQWNKFYANRLNSFRSMVDERRAWRLSCNVAD